MSSDLPIVRHEVSLPGRTRSVGTDTRGRTYELDGNAMVITSRGGARTMRLDEPGDPWFASLPRIQLEDGRDLRAAAFDVWAAAVRARLTAGASWETTYRAHRPYHTAFGMLGGVLLGVSSLWGVLAWASSEPQVRREPGLVEGVLITAGIGVLLWISFATLSSAVRLWLTRRGSWIRVDDRGVTVDRGAAPVPAADVVSATHHPLLRATSLRLRDGRRMWVPRERGPLARLDLVLAAVRGELGSPPT